MTAFLLFKKFFLNFISLLESLASPRASSVVTIAGRDWEDEHPKLGLSAESFALRRLCVHCAPRTLLSVILVKDRKFNFTRSRSGVTVICVPPWGVFPRTYNSRDICSPTLGQRSLQNVQ